ncbi:MAG: hypothetical protein LBS16_01975 [Prevotellaceae bacterium]|nr:hypothetical protein [Prevotellaceae bacterium]
MKTNLFLFAARTAAFLSVTSFSAAQVTIGGSDAPKAGAILDLNSTTKGGLVLSNVSLIDLEKIPTGTNLFPGIDGTNNNVNTDFTGAIVYNTNDHLVPNGDGLYLWDGNKWNYAGGSDGFVSIPAPTCTNPLPNLIFASYNLGADVDKLNVFYPTLSPAKQQIKYLTEVSAISATDATVYGDLYQWGRVADGHEKRSGVLLVKSKTDNPAANTFYYVDYLEPDWRYTQKDDLWGNGKGLSADGAIDKGGVLKSGSYYQNTDWAMPQNNPCPAGWRIPTQDEWERLLYYTCGAPDVASGGVNVNIATEYYKSLSGTNAPLTWVRVKDGKAHLGLWSEGDRSGWAVYKTDIWTAAIATGGYFDPTSSGTPNYANNTLYASTAPEPLLFFPAAGVRDYETGNVITYGYDGQYWSSTVESSEVYSIYISYGGGVQSDYYFTRAYGSSVRCVK